MLKKVTITISIILLCSTGGFGIGHKTNPEVIGDYIKVWGVIKYFNIPVEGKCLDMDSIFSIHVETLLSNPSVRRYNKIIHNLIGNYNNEIFIQQFPPIVIDSSNIVFSADFSWIEKSRFLNRKNASLLKTIVKQELEESNCFVSQIQNNHQVKFINEKNHLNPFPKEEIRVLSLAKYWNMVFYYYAYRDLLTVDWFQILPLFVENILRCKNSEDFHLAMLELSVLLEDSHVNTSSYILDNFWGVYKIPVSVSLFGNRVIVTSCYQSKDYQNPFRIGDEIQTIDGKTFSTGFSELRHLISGSNLSRKRFNYCTLFTRVKNENKVKVCIIRGNETMEIKCYPIHIIDSGGKNNIHYITHPKFAVYKDSISYIDPSQITVGDFKEIITKIMPTKYLVVDLRRYPNLILDSIANYLFEKPVIFSSWYSPNIKKPGSFIVRKPLTIGTKNPNYYKGTIIIMVNSASQSRAEFFTMALQKTNHNYTVGSQTSGADGDVTKFQLPGSIYTSFSGLGIKYPNGDQTQKKGVRIDLEYLPKGNLVSKSRDEELEFILQQILNKRFIKKE